MMINQTFLLLGSLAANAFFLVIAIAAMLRSTSRMDRLELMMLKLAETTAVADRVDARFARQEKLLRWIAARAQALTQGVRSLQKNRAEGHPLIERQLPMEHAVRMARHGASIDDLKRNCGLSIGEARLMKKLHGQSDGSSARH